ncbi:hypothetical protein Tsubulata_014694 [Turnera subulata]|uniref:DUF4408 domain-containing protein n=1 Tax=Turnera subulata TaxID=218843 RepID=A0A9Q0FNP7_9ROSI|nr:hypothetical protein Tsubulata_014694 [Turnera subulata]
MLEETVTSVPSIWAAMNSWFTPTVLFVVLNLMIGTIAITSSLATNKPQNEQNQREKLAQPQQGHHHQLARSPSVLQRLKSINFYNYRSQEPTTLTYEKPHEFESHFTTTLYQQTPPPQEYHHQQQQQQPPLTRSPSMLQRLRSINLYSYLSPEANAPTFQKTQEANAHYSAPEKSYHEQEQEQEEEEEQEEHEEGGVGGEEDDQIQDQEQTLDEIYSKLQRNKVSRSNSDTKPTAGEVPKKLPKKLKKSASAKSAFAHFEEEDIVETRRPATVREGKPKAKEEEEGDGEVDARADDFINKFKQQLKLQRIDSIIRYKEMIGRGTGK